MTENKDLILFYEDEYYMFSNFSSFAVEWGGKIWMTSEHAYQAAKFDDVEVVNQIFLARSAHDAKKIARRNQDKVRSGWDEEKVNVMEEILRNKLGQHEYVREMLLKSSKRELVENSHKDEFWGRGKEWKGQNMLGRLWMKLRDELAS